ncbi:MAG: hypothetical protein sL5_10220 [Candidatus Mesenet longicola]|uniref:AB hydrolase-1 domain-containing protein n=1 Tax=Candidatus Mesenet longicola TaxID=1892558 RepID=A0A8J3HW17_9RICK|nr:MAG: hypothetical protein sGL2_10800 [Candidatus Mesenet longicola]GHM60029.1 MAG: hypothetical protein sL5_10220 [Candidatus Mesenet longicola]
MIHKDISQFASSVTGKVHFVGYSMGGLLIRAYFKKYKPDKLGRVVMIGTPNHGSEVADFLKNFMLYKKLYGPAGQQLITNQDGFKEIFANTDFELGIIAGNKSIDPISSKLINKPNDGKVSVDSTKLEGAKDHIVLPCNHTFFPSNKQMFKQVLSFLKFGKFIQNHNLDKAKQD